MQKNKFNKSSKLYIKDKNTSNITSFLYDFFITRRRPATYHDEKCSKEHTSSSRHRSFDDIYILARTYFPEITIEEVLIELMFLGRSQHIIPYFYKCGEMGKIRITYNYYNEKSIIAALTGSKNNLFSMYAWDVKLPYSMYKWSELFSKIGIDDSDSFHNAITSKEWYDNMKKSMSIEQKAIEKVKAISTSNSKFPKTVSGLVVKKEPSINDNVIVYIGSQKFEKDKLKGILKRFSPFKNGNETNLLSVSGSITIDGKKVTPKQIERIYKLL